MYLYHMTFLANQNLFDYHETEQPCARGQHQNTKKNSICKQAGLYILHTKWGLVVRGHLEPLCIFIVTSKTNFMFLNSTRGCLQADDISI